MALLAAGAEAAAEVHHAAEAAGHGDAGVGHGKDDVGGTILHHISDGYTIEIPIPFKTWGHEIDLKEIFHGWTVQVGGTTIDFTPTKNTIFMWLAAILVVLMLTRTASKLKKDPVPRGFSAIIEMVVLFIRDDIAKKNGATKFVPYLATAFFFILTMNLLGLVPYSATATSNLSVTATMATITFIVVQVAGMRGQGVVGYWKHLLPSGVPLWLAPIMIPVEILGLFTKPFALAVRLFANMVAGHFVILSLLSIIFILKVVWVAPLSVAFALAIFMLELFVALVQAYIFTMLSAVFIGMAYHPSH
jgi:F-type H+-transporting ATPase subunit a